MSNQHNYKKSELEIYRQWKIINRTIPLAPVLNKEIENYKKNCSIDISGRLFTIKNNKSLASNLKYHYTKVGYNISIHGLILMLGLAVNGVDFKTVAELIGDTVEIVIPTYSYFTGNMLENTKKAVNSIKNLDDSF